jgi:hypothetical protein
MKAPYFVEILARNGDVLHRHRLQQLPIRIGRGYDNDVILDDAHSAASHASRNGRAHQMLLRDLGSKNGSYYGGKRCEALRSTATRVVRLGHTRLRVRRAISRWHRKWPTPPCMAGKAPPADNRPGADRRVRWWRPGSDVEPFALIRYLLVLASSLAPACCGRRMGTGQPPVRQPCAHGPPHVHPRQRPGVMGVWRLLSTAWPTRGMPPY